MKRFAKLGFALLLTANAPGSFACGVCVEDKIAAVYDHTMVTRAFETGHQVLFCAIEGDIIPSNTLTRELRQALESIPGVDRGSVRVSLEAASLVFIFDPSRASGVALLPMVNRKLVIHGIMLVRLPNRIAGDQALR